MSVHGTGGGGLPPFPDEGGGVSLAKVTMGILPKNLIGVPLLSGLDGVTLSPPGLDGEGTAEEYLKHGLRYASCVHAGGLCYLKETSLACEQNDRRLYTEKNFGVPSEVMSSSIIALRLVVRRTLRCFIV